MNRRNDWHSSGLCLFCDPAVSTSIDAPSTLYTHDRKKCPVFRFLKAGLNERSYCSTGLEASEAKGFAAAGVIFVTRIRRWRLEHSTICLPRTSAALLS